MSTTLASNTTYPLHRSERPVSGPNIYVRPDLITRLSAPVERRTGPIHCAYGDADLGRLTAAQGAAFDKQFLTMMIGHHEGAITMAKQETMQGSNADAKTLAQKIITDQQAEISTMQGILAHL